MVPESDPDDIAGTLQPFCYGDVVPACRKISARVVVTDYDAVDGLHNGEPEDLPWMNKGIVESSESYEVDEFDRVTGGQANCPEVLFVAIHFVFQVKDICEDPRDVLCGTYFNVGVFFYDHNGIPPVNIFREN